MREGQILVGCQVFPGLLCDVAGHRMSRPTPPKLESVTAIACPRRISREAPRQYPSDRSAAFPATDIETVIVKSVNGYFVPSVSSQGPAPHTRIIPAR